MILELSVKPGGKMEVMFLICAGQQESNSLARQSSASVVTDATERQNWNFAKRFLILIQ